MPTNNPKTSGSAGEVERRLKNAVTAIRNSRLELEASNVPFRTGWWERLERDAALELAEWQKRFGLAVAAPPATCETVPPTTSHFTSLEAAPVTEGFGAYLTESANRRLAPTPPAPPVPPCTVLHLIDVLQRFVSEGVLPDAEVSLDTEDCSYRIKLIEALPGGRVVILHADE